MQEGLKRFDMGLRRSRQAWFGRITALFERPSLDDSLWQELEETLILADVGVETTGKLLEGLRARVRREGIREPLRAREVLEEEVTALLDRGGTGIGLTASALRPYVVLMVGVNGVGKTTSIAKMAYYLQRQGRDVLLAAADTFRAAAIEQLQLWGRRLGVEVVAHKPGADPGAVAFDAVQAAKSRGLDALIIDTAGRMHTKYNLMEELKKVKRVVAKAEPSAPHEVILVMDATTGQNGLSQAQYFTEAVGVTGIFLAKLDGTAKGGIVIAIADQLQLPIQFLGTGEGLEDMVEFDARAFAAALLG